MGKALAYCYLNQAFIISSNWRQTMSSKTNALPNPLRTKTKRSPPDSRRRFRRRHCPVAASAIGAPNPNTNNGETTSSSSSDVSAKLEALQNLIPTRSAVAHGEARQTEQLFKETADYIVLLKTQVVILQKLVDFFGSGCSDTENAVVS